MRTLHRSVLLGTVFVFLLTACQPPAAPTAPAEISGQISFMISGDPAELQAYQTLVEAFKKAQPKIAVELIHMPKSSDYTTRLAADFTAGTPANIILLNYRSYAGFAARGVLESLSPYLLRSTVIHEADFYAEVMAPFYWDKQLMCLPQNVSSPVVYYNKNLFDAAGVAYPKEGWMWDDFLAAAQALTRDTNGDGQPEQYGLGVEPSLIRVAPFIWQNGGNLVDSNVTPKRLMLDEKQALEAVQWFVDLQVKHHVVPSAEAEASEPSESRFLNGRTAMYINSRRTTPTFRAITAFDWDVAGLPQNKGRQTSILHSDGYCLTAATQNKEAAWKLIEFANSVEGQTIIAATGRTVPSLKVVAESPAFLDPNAKPAHNRVFLDAIPYLRATPVLKNWTDIEGQAGQELKRAFYGQATVAEAVKAAVLGTDEYFKK